jgi:hypothetical protein
MSLSRLCSLSYRGPNREHPNNTKDVYSVLLPVCAVSTLFHQSGSSTAEVWMRYESSFRIVHLVYVRAFTLIPSANRVLVKFLLLVVILASINNISEEECEGNSSNRRRHHHHHRRQ